MAKGGRRDIVPSKGGKGWDLKKPGANQPVSHHRKQSTAEQAGRRDLGRGSGGELVTHGRDGKIRSKDTIPPGRDPHPPKDKEH